MLRLITIVSFYMNRNIYIYPFFYLKMVEKIKRPIYEYQLNTRVPKEVFEAVEKKAHDNGDKSADIIRKAIVLYLKVKGYLNKKKHYL